MNLKRMGRYEEHENNVKFEEHEEAEEHKRDDKSISEITMSTSLRGMSEDESVMMTSMARDCLILSCQYIKSFGIKKSWSEFYFDFNFDLECHLTIEWRFGSYQTVIKGES